jgi:asparagine synthetase B (glutamine-hydrolysing)
MEYVLHINRKGVTCSGDAVFVSVTDGGCEIHGMFTSESRLGELLSMYRTGKLEQGLDAITEHRFFAWIHDSVQRKVIVINDKFGSNEVFFTERESGWIVSNRIRNVFGDKHPTINTQSLYEFMFLYTVIPPRTIYEGISAVPMASILTIDYDNGSVATSRYWDVERRFTPKSMDYTAHVARIRSYFFEAIASETDDTTGVALSGGIDSGAILAMATQTQGKPLLSITFGGRGKDTPDLVEGSRLTVQELHSPNHELFPSFEAFRKLPVYMSDLDQPIVADVVWPNGMVYEKAQELGLAKLLYGFGAEMLLGNLKIAKVYNRIKWPERFLPRFILNPIYKLIASFLKISQNQLDFLLAKTWARRFIIARGPMFTRERRLGIYKSFPTDFLDVLERELNERIGSKDVAQGDRFVMMYLLNWVSYMQLRDFSALGRQFGVVPFCPFDIPLVAEGLFKTPTKFRKINGWSKQVLRDMYRPYVSDRLYRRVIRSLIIPYNEFFSGTEKYFFSYLRTSPVVTAMVDMDVFEKNFSKLPEPGQALMRLIGLAVWHDAHWGKERLKGFEHACLNAEQAHAL